jgi:hypothetical protein
MKTLSLTDFKNYSFEQKCEVVTIYADYIMHREFPKGKAYLYHANSFFIEVVYSSVYKKILMINAFEDLTQLGLYADTISLADLNL